MGHLRRDPWTREFADYADGFSDCWGEAPSETKWVRKKNTQEAGKGYLRALLLPGGRKSMAPMAHRLGVNPNVLQQFVTDSPWDDEAVLRTNIRIMKRRMSGPQGVLLLDDTSILKRGEKSVGVTHQYSGQVGGAAHCQATVSCLYVLPGMQKNRDALSWPVGMQLYLPKDWAKDKARRKVAKVPKNVRFLTKDQIGLRLIDRAVEEEVPFRAVVTDGGYGSNGPLRAELRRRRLPYVVGVGTTKVKSVAEGTPLALPAGGPPRKFVRQFASYPRDVEARTPLDWSRVLPPTEWHRIAWTEGSKGLLEGGFARIRVRVVHRRRGRRATDETGWLLLERQGDELKAFLAWGLDGLSLKDLVRLAHTRWAIEQSYQQMKNELGLDHFEGRTWRGWHHHATLVMLAYSFLMLLRAKGNMAEEDVPTLPEVRRRLIETVSMWILRKELGITERRAKKALQALPWILDE